jgi:hypothetical protein
VRVYDLGPTVDAATSGGSGSGGGGGGGGGCGGGGGRPVLPAPLFEIPRAHSAPLAAAAWSADASLLATASTKGTLVRVWEVERRARRGGGAAIVGRKLCAFRRGSTPAGATALAFGPPREAGGGSIGGEQQQQQQQRQQQQQPRRPRRPRRPELLAAASERGTVHLFRLPREREDEEEGGDEGGAGERGAVAAGREGQGAGRAVAALLSSSSRALLSGSPRAPPSAAAAARLPDALAARAVATVRLPAPTAGVSLALYAKGGGGASGGKQEEKKQTGAGGGGGGSESDGERDGASSLDGAPRAEPSSEPPAKAATTVTVLGLAVATVEGALYEYSVEIDRAKFRGRRGSGGRSNSGGGGTGGGGENDSGVSVSLERELFVGRGAD